MSIECPANLLPWCWALSKKCRWVTLRSGVNTHSKLYLCSETGKLYPWTEWTFWWMPKRRVTLEVIVITMGSVVYMAPASTITCAMLPQLLDISAPTSVSALPHPVLRCHGAGYRVRKLIPSALRERLVNSYGTRLAGQCLVENITSFRIQKRTVLRL